MKLESFFGRAARRWRARAALREAGGKLYMAAVRQARARAFYAEGGVPDTLDGRFDMIVLHAALLVRRLRGCGDAGRALAQSLFDAMFDDMDRSLREMGVGDLRVGKRVKQMARAFYGRAEAYDRALNRAPGSARREALAAVLVRNLYGGEAPPDDRVETLTRYVEALDDALANREADAILRGEAGFLPPPAFR